MQCIECEPGEFSSEHSTGLSVNTTCVGQSRSALAEGVAKFDLRTCWLSAGNLPDVTGRHDIEMAVMTVDQTRRVCAG